jgi:hypothetical protein
MKPRTLVTLILGIVLFLFGIYLLIFADPFGVIPLLIGVSLAYLGWRGGRIPVIIFGHTCIVIGCLLVTWGIYLLPYSKPIFAHIFLRPLFWGFISIFGGICANYHGFCQCMRKPTQ